jgi:rubrerythrin
MEKLAQRNREKVIDLLAERLAFERTSVKLYEKVLARMRTGAHAPESGDYSTYGLSGYRSDALSAAHDDISREQGRPGSTQASPAPALAQLLPRIEKVRDQEKEHEQWLEACIRSLGGDPRRKTERSKLTARETSGIEEVVMRDAELPHLLHALLAAEEVESAGWDLLAELANEAGDDDARSQFEKRLQEERQHLDLLREAVRAYSAREILGEGAAPAQGKGPAAP